MEEMAALAPVRVTVSVARPVPEACRLFTEGINSWWPLRTHSVGEERAQEALFEPRERGRIYERMTGGQEADWGRVLVWEPPSRVVFSWQPNAEAPAPTEVEVRFSAEAGGTRVEVEHRGWAALGDIAAERRAQYASESGWPKVIGLFETAAA